MKIIVIGTGYVGLVQGAGMAKGGHEVWCVDVDAQKIAQLQAGEMPFFEPGLAELVQAGVTTKSLFFTTDLRSCITGADAIFIAVGTPSRDDGSVDLQYIDAVADSIGSCLQAYTVVVNKSTVPVGTGKRVHDLIRRHYGGEFSVVSNPEFLAQGNAVKNFFEPDRIVIGVEVGDSRAEKLMCAMYDFVDTEIMVTDLATAELIKYASNAFLATQISFINSLAPVCEKIGADVTEIARGMRLDKRISPKAFLNAGIGYGGSCFSKDIKGLLHTVGDLDVSVPLLEEVEAANMRQRAILYNKVVSSLTAPLQESVIGVWGLSFKPKTDDTREAPALALIQRLLDEGVKQIIAYDPVSMARVREEIVDERLVLANDMIEPLAGAVLVLCTEWSEFVQADKTVLAEQLVGKTLVDGRNVMDKAWCVEQGIRYIGIGR